MHMCVHTVMHTQTHVDCGMMGEQSLLPASHCNHTVTPEAILTISQRSLFW